MSKTNHHPSDARRSQVLAVTLLSCKIFGCSDEDSALIDDDTVSLRTQAGYQGYAFDNLGGDERSNADWMAPLPDQMSLSDLSIPGTHDSGTWKIWDGNIVPLTQRMSIARQLEAGVRAFDIRCHHKNDFCQLYHGIVDLDQNLTEVLGVMIQFLQAHPSETVILMINNPEHYGGGPTDGGPTDCTRSFTETFDQLYWKDPNYGEYFWKPNGQQPSEIIPKIPNLGEVRGKIIVMQDFGPGPLQEGWTGWYGLPGQRWFNLTSHVRTQNDWELTSNWSLYDKWTKVKQFFWDANHRAPCDRAIYQNWLNGSVGSFPYFVASGKSSPSNGDPLLWTGLIAADDGGEPYPDFPRYSCAGALCSVMFQGVNILTHDISLPQLENSAAPYAGLVMADFPDVNLIERVFRLSYENAAFRGLDDTTVTPPEGWCVHNGAVRYDGDFDGDGQLDLLCRDFCSGNHWIDYYNNNLDGIVQGNWCYHAGAQFVLGDFDGDGRKDWMCHSTDTGYKWIDYAYNGFGATDWEQDTVWCSHMGARFSVADVDGDARDDMVCQNPGAGYTWHDYAADGFSGTNWEG